MSQAPATHEPDVTIAKSQLEKMLDKLPDPVPVEELIHRLYLWEKWARSDEDIAAGRVHTQEEIEAQVAEWEK